MSLVLTRVHVAVVALIVAACGTESSLLTDEDEAAIRELHETFEAAALSRDWPTALALYADDAVQLVPEAPPVCGRAAIVERAEDFSSVTFVERSHTIEDVYGRGDIAYVWGIISQRVTWEGQDTVLEGGGRMLRILRKQPDGRWLISVEIWNYD